MNQTYPVGRVLGIRVDVHATFALFLAVVGLGGLVAGGVGGLLGELVFAGLLFGMVLLHELGHALTARQFGVRTQGITLLPFGGVALMDAMPARPGQEILVALAGPAVNMAIATVLLAVSGPETLAGYGLLGRLLWINVGLALFNLIPAFPMDGGRVLRAWLTGRVGARAATLTAAAVAQVAAGAMGVVGLLTSPMLVLIAIWVWLQADAEKELARGGLRGPEVVDAQFEDEAPRVVIRRVVRRGPPGW